mgnify:CR=1 FL=1
MIYKFAIAGSILFILFILYLVKKEKIDEKYSILWLIFGIIILAISIFPKIIEYIANIFEIYYPPSLLLLLGIIILIIYIVHITIVITKQNKMIIRLNQEIRNTK